MQFSELNLFPQILHAVEEIGFTEATDIQSGAIPLLLQGKDVIGRSSTGTGKTAAFGIPVVQMVAQSGGERAQVLILSPTRELAMQTNQEIQKFSRFLSNVHTAIICGGQSFPDQFRQLRNAQIVIGTPGRIMDHMRRNTLSLNNLKTVVLDEADEMLNMGFLEDIQTILTEAPENRQTVLFSATMPLAIMKITKEFQTDPEIIAVDKGQKTVDNISQFYYHVQQEEKTDALKLLLEFYRPKRALVFCNTKKMVDELCAELNGSGFPSAALHGDLKQSQRNQVMNDFKNGRTGILIATDVAARGIDVEDVEAVFNYDIPQENEYYIHRIGRTGRAGKTGASHTLATSRSQLEKVHLLERFMKTQIQQAAIPNLEEIHARNAKVFGQNIRKMVEEKTGSAWVPFVEELENEGCSATEIAAALCAKLDSRNRRLASVKNVRKAETPAGSEKTWLNIDLGTDDKVTANLILAAIVEAAGLPAKSIGKIHIFKTYTNVEMSPEDANLVIKKMANSNIRQRTAHFTIAGKSKREAADRMSSGNNRRNDRRKGYSGGQRGKSEQKHYGRYSHKN